MNNFFDCFMDSKISIEKRWQMMEGNCKRSSLSHSPLLFLLLHMASKSWRCCDMSCCCLSVIMNFLWHEIIMIECYVVDQKYKLAISTHFVCYICAWCFILSLVMKQQEKHCMYSFVYEIRFRNVNTIMINTYCGTHQV